MLAPLGEATEMSLYSTLGVDSNCSREELKKAYHSLMIQHHPDKTRAAETVRFQEIRAAYEILGDALLRKDYDQNMVYESRIISSEEIDLRKFEERDGLFATPCRCGDYFEISSEELEQGINTIQCNGCSLYVTVQPQTIQSSPAP